MEIKIKIYLQKENSFPFIGRGPVDLLQEISRKGSIKKAASAMDMSYSKAHALICAMEENLHQKLLRKSSGGKNGGGSRLTPEAEKLIENYRSMEKDIKNYARRRFRESGI